MQCHKCGNEMMVNREDFSFDTRKKPNKKDTRKVYWCKKDDIWISLEVPVVSKK